jgi:hypothetical protein
LLRVIIACEAHLRVPRLPQDIRFDTNLLGLLRESRVLKLYSVTVRPQAEMHQWRPTHDNHHASVAPTVMGGYHLNCVKRWTRSCTISSVKVRVRGEHSVRWARVTRGTLTRMCLCHPRRGFGKQLCNPG